MKNIIKFCQQYKKLAIGLIILAIIGVTVDYFITYVYPLYKTQKDIPFEWDKTNYVNSKLREELKQSVVGIFDGTYATGVIIGSNNSFVLILTNAHVVLGLHEDSKIHFVTDEYNIAVKNIEILNIDLFNDLALLGIKVPNVVKFKSMEIAKENAKIGDKVYALGNPLGLEHIYTEGKVIYVNNIKKLYISNPSAPGSSGTPIVNEKGELVGLIHALGYTNLRDTKCFYTYITICIGRESILDFIANTIKKLKK